MNEKKSLIGGCSFLLVCSIIIVMSNWSWCINLISFLIMIPMGLSIILVGQKEGEPKNEHP